MQVPHRVHAEVWAQSDLQPNQGRYGGLERLCECKGIEMIEGLLMPDRVRAADDPAEV